MRACVLVVGDAGHSPRMLLHTRSLLQQAGCQSVDFIGDLHTGSKLPVDLAADQRITWHHLPSSLPDAPLLRLLPYIIRSVLKAIYQLLYLLILLTLHIPSPAILLLQTPPAIPTLICAQLACKLWLKETKIIIDWHNFAYTLMSLNEGKQSVGGIRPHFIALARWLEKWWGRHADVHLCVTRAMAEFLRTDWRVSGEIRVLYDRPLPSFHRLPIEEMHEFLSRLNWPADISQLFDSLDGSGNRIAKKTLLTQRLNDGTIIMRPDRPLLIVSSTSWTADEDMSPLLQAINDCEKYLLASNQSSRSTKRHLIFIITGKGELRSEFERKIKTLQLRHISVLTMWLLIEDYPRLLGAADLGICMHSSSSGLDLPMKVVDMFGCGLPVCAVDYDCIRELIRPGKTGLLFKTSDQLTGHLKQLLLGSNDDLLQGMRQEIIDEFQSDSNRWQSGWPSGQIRLTNVSVVRLKKGGKRFEIACYKNKVMEYRSGVETDLDNVLQTATIFVNVSKGQLASKEDVEKAFNTADDKTVILEILKKGELQVSALERNSQLQSLQKDIVSIITDKTVNPSTKRPYPATMIDKALGELHYNINSARNPKQQALEIIKQLQERNIIPIARAQMRIQLILPSKESKRVKEKLMPMISQVEQEDFGNVEYQMECLIDPGQFRPLSDLLQQETKGRGRLDLLSLKETVDHEEKF